MTRFVGDVLIGTITPAARERVATGPVDDGEEDTHWAAM